MNRFQGLESEIEIEDEEIVPDRVSDLGLEATNDQRFRATNRMQKSVMQKRLEKILALDVVPTSQLVPSLSPLTAETVDLDINPLVSGVGGARRTHGCAGEIYQQL